MPRSARLWLFDLDNTLHHAGIGIFPRINQQMTDYIVQHLALTPDEAQQLRIDYWQRYGATLTGLVRHHAVDPQHFLHHTHPLPELLAHVHHDAGLPALIARLPGRKVVFSNGPTDYVQAVCRHLRLLPHLQQVFGVDRVGFHPKPERRGYVRLLAQLGRPASRCILVEDSLANLATAKALGMRTVWLAPQAAAVPGYVDVCVRRIGELARHAGLAR